MNSFNESIKHKVALLGASGGIGQPLSLLLKLNPRINQLALYDIEKAATPCCGVSCDVSHVNTPCEVNGYTGIDGITECLKNASVVIITAGVPRKPGMTRDDLFKINAGIVKQLAEQCAKNCPKAFVCIVSNPVNSTVPIAAEVFKKHNVFNPNKIAGVTTLDSIRASTFVAEAIGENPNMVTVPVIGGHAGETILPILSQSNVNHQFDSKKIQEMDIRIQNAGTEVVNAKGGAGSATLSMAYAASKFTDAVLCGLSGVMQTVHCYVAFQFESCDYFALKCDLGPNGIHHVHPPRNLTPYEQTRLNAVKAKLLQDIETGVTYAKTS